MSYSRTFGEFIRRTSFEKLPDKVKDVTKSFILDLLGVILAGSRSESGRIMERLARGMEGRKESTVIPLGFKTSCLDAALVNGTFANGVSLNDIHPPSGAHLGPVVIPAAFSMGEKVGACGKDVITAVVVGYEIMGRVGKAVHTSHMERGFHPTATCGAFGAAAVASKLLDLSVEETIWALGNAGTQSCGLTAFLDDGAMTIAIHPGVAARNGIFAALLAKEGFTGAEYIFESKGGFLRAMADTYRAEKLSEGLGEDYEILHTGFKPYDCCRLTHSSIDAVLGIFKDHGHLEPESIENMIANVSLRAANHGGYYPRTPAGARCSFPFNLALLLLSGIPRVEPISTELIEDPKVKGMAERIKMVPHPDLPRYASEIKIRTKDGKILSKKVELPKGEPENPLTPDEIKNKFRFLARKGHIGEKQIEDIIVDVGHLEEIKKISLLVERLVKK